MSFFSCTRSVPKDERFTKWLAAFQTLNNQDNICKSGRVCSKHFIEDDFLSKAKRFRLKKDAVPSIFRRPVVTNNNATDAVIAEVAEATSIQWWAGHNWCCIIAVYIFMNSRRKQYEKKNRLPTQNICKQFSTPGIDVYKATRVSIYIYIYTCIHVYNSHTLFTYKNSAYNKRPTTSNRKHLYSFFDSFQRQTLLFMKV